MDVEIGSLSVTATDVHQLLIVHQHQEMDSRGVGNYTSVTVSLPEVLPLHLETFGLVLVYITRSLFQMIRSLTVVWS